MGAQTTVAISIVHRLQDCVILAKWFCTMPPLSIPIIVVKMTPMIFPRYKAPMHIMAATINFPALIGCRSTLSAGTVLTKSTSTGMPIRYMGAIDRIMLMSPSISHSGRRKKARYDTSVCTATITMVPRINIPPSLEK